MSGSIVPTPYLEMVRVAELAPSVIDGLKADSVQLLYLPDVETEFAGHRDAVPPNLVLAADPDVIIRISRILGLGLGIDVEIQGDCVILKRSV